MNPVTNTPLNTKNVIIDILKKKPYCRDNDNRLIANFWNRELVHQQNPPGKMTAFYFLTLFSAGKITHPETIRRTRQKIQEEQPELRGKKYEQRQAEAEEVRNTINQ